jgi:hypothetical protein
LTVSHPPIDQLQRHLKTVASKLEKDGTLAVALASELAARGYPTGTLGDGGSRSSSDSSSTERHGLANNRTDDKGAETWKEDRWADVDKRLARLLRLTWAASVELHGLVADLVAHGDTSDQLVAGAGPCLACDHICRPDVALADRLRSGLCPACAESWRRWRIKNPQGIRGDFLMWRKAQLKKAATAVKSSKNAIGITPHIDPKKRSA